MVEAALLQRKGIGMDIHPEVVAMARERIHAAGLRAEFHVGDARSMRKVPSDGIDLVAFHPPYASIIRYGREVREGDLSAMRGFGGFLDGLRQVAGECLRVVKPGAHCAVMLGDTRKGRHYVPLAFLGMTEFLRAGFLLREDVVKLQWNMRGTLARWMGRQDFYRIAHEHIFIFRKPMDTQDEVTHRWSTWKGTWARCRE